MFAYALIIAYAGFVRIAFIRNFLSAIGKQISF